MASRTTHGSRSTTSSATGPAPTSESSHSEPPRRRRRGCRGGQGRRRRNDKKEEEDIYHGYGRTLNGNERRVAGLNGGHIEGVGEERGNTIGSSSISSVSSSIPASPNVSLKAKEQAIPGLKPEVLDAVVKVYATHCYPNYSLPWSRKRQTLSTSSGFVVSGRGILTNAHSVQHHTLVKVKKRGSDHKYIARVLSIGNECDIALMTVDDEAFWKGIKPLNFGVLPALQDSVCVTGYAIGGENISVTAGVVSRIEIQEYSHATSDLLGLQIDAAINYGASGAPGLNSKQEVVGIAFQSYHSLDSENVGYLIAVSVVQRFLSDYYRNGRYTGFCCCGFDYQKMENEDLRMSLQMGKDESGILVRHVEVTTEASKHLFAGDIVTHIDGTGISNEGNVPYRNGEKISFIYLITLKFVGDSVTFRVLRKGKPLEVTYALGESSRPLLVPTYERRRLPEYLTIAGLVFVAFTEPYMISEYGSDFILNAPVKLLDKIYNGHKKTPDHQVVVLSQVLNAEVNVGYEYLGNLVLYKFNGQDITNLAHLAKLVRGTQEEYFRFDLENHEVVVVSRRRAQESENEILETHGIPAASSIGDIIDPVKISPQLQDSKGSWNEAFAHGVVANGVVRNRTVANGLAANGTTANSTTANGATANGTTAKGTIANGAASTRLAANEGNGYEGHSVILKDGKGGDLERGSGDERDGNSNESRGVDGIRAHEKRLILYTENGSKRDGSGGESTREDWNWPFEKRLILFPGAVNSRNVPLEYGNMGDRSLKLRESGDVRVGNRSIEKGDKENGPRKDGLWRGGNDANTHRSGASRRDSPRGGGVRTGTPRGDGNRGFGSNWREGTGRDVYRNDGNRGSGDWRNGNRNDGSWRDGNRRETERRDSYRRDNERRDSYRQDSERKDMRSGEREREDIHRGDSERRDVHRRDSEREDVGRRDGERRDGERRDGERRDVYRRESERRDVSRGDNERRDVRGGDGGRRDVYRSDSDRRDGGRRDGGRGSGGGGSRGGGSRGGGSGGGGSGSGGSGRRRRGKRGGRRRGGRGRGGRGPGNKSNGSKDDPKDTNRANGFASGGRPTDKRSDDRKSHDNYRGSGRDASSNYSGLRRDNSK